MQFKSEILILFYLDRKQELKREVFFILLSFWVWLKLCKLISLSFVLDLFSILFFFWFETVTYDTRGQSHAEARHWSEEKILGGRAFFHEDLKQI